MKKFIVGLLALGAVCVFVPSALADSFGYLDSSSIVATHSRLGSRHVGFGAVTSSPSSEGGFQFESLSNSGQWGNGTSTTPDVLVEVRGHELNLLSSHFGGSKAEGRGNGHFSFADEGSYRGGNGITLGNSELSAETATLAATPEPGSLLLLGTGLLCMALFLFRKSAKHATES